jgi:hypothetical protein
VLNSGPPETEIHAVPTTQWDRKLFSAEGLPKTALGSFFSASYLGKLGDRPNHGIIISGVMTLAICLPEPQAYVIEAWQLIGLRFAMGLALGGLSILRT